MSIQTIPLAKIYFLDAETRTEAVDKLRQIVKGTYMKLKINCAPYQGEFHISVTGEAETEEELKDMVLDLLTRLAMDL